MLKLTKTYLDVGTEQATCKKLQQPGFGTFKLNGKKTLVGVTHYHDRIIVIIEGERGTGVKRFRYRISERVISLPLCAIVCEVTALEPSFGMRNLRLAEAFTRRDASL